MSRATQMYRWVCEVKPKLMATLQSLIGLKISFIVCLDVNI